MRVYVFLNVFSLYDLKIKLNIDKVSLIYILADQPSVVRCRDNNLVYNYYER